ncbi:MAG TPA: ammonium transporter [Acidimicrobiales bacterium]|jgi:Amt family ammonium transporter|nr:ammonium transporter [Acidimicrobiales bacterium]
MDVRPLLLSIFTLALLLPVMYRRYQRRTGAPAASYRNRTGRLLVAAMASLVFVGVIGGAAFASNGDKDGSKTGTDVVNLVTAEKQADRAAPTPEEVATATEKNRVAINLTWLMLGGILVLFMQAGFALVETGFTRAKNAAHTMMMNLVIFALGVVGWFTCGYALMFGATDYHGILGLTALGSPVHIGSWNIIAKSGFFLSGHAYDVSIMAFFFFQLVFMDATATIPTGAMAERWKFSSFCVWGLFASMLLYPIYGNWVWGGGFLSQLGVLGPKWGHGAVDFAGSGVVHAMGGVAAFWGAKILGPRVGKFDKDGKARAIPGHHLPMALLGTFILLVGWMGFNGGSTFAGTDFRFTVVITNTILASAFGCLSCMLVMWRMFGKPDPSMTANGLLAGLVAITAPCAFVAPWAAAVIGTIAGVLVVAVVLVVERRFKVDDPVGAVAVHGANGLWGLLAVGLFADGTYGAGLNGVAGGVKGLFYGDAGQLAAQVTNMVVLVVFCSVMTVTFFSILKRTVGMRSDQDAEIAGLDMPEMGALAYPDFLEAQGPVFFPVDDGPRADGPNAPVSAAALREEMVR